MSWVTSPNHSPEARKITLFFIKDQWISLPHMGGRNDLRACKTQDLALFSTLLEGEVDNNTHYEREKKNQRKTKTGAPTG